MVFSCTIKNATSELFRLEQAFAQVKSQLFDNLHELIRNDIFDTENSDPSRADFNEEKNITN